VPQGDELKILEPFRSQVPDEVFTAEYNPPHYDGSGEIRDGLRQALALLKDAGWSFKGEQLVNNKTGEPFIFEILNDDPALERVELPFIQNLKRLGITATIRTVRRVAIRAADDQFRLRHGCRGHRPVAIAR